VQKSSWQPFFTNENFFARIWALIYFFGMAKLKIIRVLMTLGLCIVFMFSAIQIGAAKDKSFGATDYKERRDSLYAQITDGVAIVVNYSRVLARTRTDPEFLYRPGVDTSKAKLILVPKEIDAIEKLMQEKTVHIIS
jgi:hypothetical protein